jgi:hypothetical protein
MRSSDAPSSSCGQASGLPQPGGAPTRLRPTRVRWHIVALLAVISGLTYLDRLNLSIAAGYIQDEFAFGTETMGWNQALEFATLVTLTAGLLWFLVDAAQNLEATSGTHSCSPTLLTTNCGPGRVL